MSESIKSDGWDTDYYQLPEGAKELQDLIEHKAMNFARGNIFKAAYRLGGKTGTSAAYDLNKIIWYAQRELARLELRQMHEQRFKDEYAGSGASFPAT